MKILVVAQIDSIHTARWVNQFGSKYEIYLFPSIFRKAHPSLQKRSTFNPLFSNSADEKGIFLVQTLPWSWLNFVFNGVIHKFISKSWKTWLLKKTIQKLQPHVVHSLELQNAGYLSLDVKNDLGQAMPIWIVTNWGSDIYYFSQFEEHRKRLVDLLKKADFYSAECKRDYTLARELGMTAQPLPIIPNAGGLDLELCHQLRIRKKTSERKIILLKGYQSVFGRAFHGIEALAQIQSQLQGMTIVIYSASQEVKEKAQSLLTQPGLSLEIHTEHLSHSQILELQSQSRIYIGLSVSDGICTSLLESMALGSFPIQTDTSCADEWMIPNLTGFAVKLDEIQRLSELILSVVQNDLLVDQAAQTNWEIISQKASAEKVHAVAKSFYEITKRKKTPAP